MEEFITVAAIIVAFSAGLLIGLFILRPQKSLKLKDYQEKADKIEGKTQEEITKIQQEAEERAARFQARLKEGMQRQQENFKRVEKLIESKNEQIKNKKEKNTELKGVVDYENNEIESFRKKTEEIEKEFIIKLSGKSGTTTKEAKVTILDNLKSDLENAKEKRTKNYLDSVEDNKERIAKNMLISAIQRYASPTSVEKRGTIITVPKDEIKGKIVGKNAENVLLLEELTGTDIIFNDQPNSIIVSSYELVKKHVAKETINKLMGMKDVNPEIIKKTIKEVKNETISLLTSIGQRTLKELGLEHRKFPAEFCKIIGKLQFRSSYGQNILKHSLEVGYFTLMLASELGLNMETSKIGGFFHDLGKAIDQDIDEPHDILTKKIMEKFGFSEQEIHAAWTHHDSIPIKSAEALLVKAADAISAGRPGARQESLEKYLEHIRMVEEVANSYEGVKKAFAMSAGREVRMYVDPERLDDENLPELAKMVADEIQENLAYPGKIRIKAIRRTNNIEIAKK